MYSPNAQTGGDFGLSVARTSNIVVVGAPGESSGGFSKAGNVYVFNASTGSFITKLSSPNAQTDGDFGISVAVNGSLVIVGAEDEKVSTDPSAGRAYVFEVNTTGSTLIRTLQAPDPQSNAFFGNSVGISGNTAVVGAYKQTGVGAVFVFNALTGSLISTPFSPNARTNGFFGFSVAIDGNTVAVGAPGETVAFDTDAGHAYTFNALSGKLIDTYASPSAQQNGFFGWSVSINRNFLAVGAPGESSGAGSSYLFNTMTSSRTDFSSPNAQAGGEFGWSVSVFQKFVIVGAPNETVGANTSAGRAYVFYTNSGGSLNSTVVSPNPQMSQEFGTSVSLASNYWTAIIGGSGATVDDPISFAGEALIVTPQFPLGSILAILAPIAAVAGFYYFRSRKTAAL